MLSAIKNLPFVFAHVAAMALKIVHNIRSAERMQVNAERIRNSIRQTGEYRQDSTLRVEDIGNGEYMVINGHGRTMAVQGLTENERQQFSCVKLPCHVYKNLTPEQRVELQIDDFHSQHTQLELDRNDLFLMIVDILKNGGRTSTGEKYTQEKIAERLGWFYPAKHAKEGQPNRSKVQPYYELAVCNMFEPRIAEHMALLCTNCVGDKMINADATPFRISWKTDLYKATSDITGKKVKETFDMLMAKPAEKAPETKRHVLTVEGLKLIAGRIKSPMISRVAAALLGVNRDDIAKDDCPEDISVIDAELCEHYPPENAPEKPAKKTAKGKN